MVIASAISAEAQVELSQKWSPLALPGTIIRRYSKRTVLFTHGSKLEHIIVIVDGWVKLYTETIDGKELVVELLSSGGLLGENAILRHGEESYSAEIISTTATILEIPVSSVLENMKHNPETSYYFVSHLIKHVQQLRTHVEELTSAIATERVIKFLLSLCEAEGKQFTLPCEKTKLAPYLGMERETLSRIMSQLKKYCALEVDGSMITIPCRNTLLEYGFTLASEGHRFNASPELADG